jgi:esterase/lipase superfamily enzyme
MEQLALKHHQDSADEIFEQLRIRNVILVGSDLDRGVFDAYLADGLLKTTKHLTVYMSENDTALGVSQFLTRRERVGQMFGETGGEMTESGKKAMVKLRNQLSLINVSDAEGAETGNGHGYFRSSPWASSDILMTLYYGLLPDQRGLIQKDDLPVYSFPPDYLSRLWDTIGDVDPEFAQKYEALKEKQTISAE